MRVTKPVRNCSVLLLTVQVVSLLSCTNAFPATEDDDIGTHPIIVDVTCYDVYNTPYVELIPHESNCTRFFQCKLDDLFVPQPLPQYCSNGLIYNFNLCACDWPENAKDNCFDSHNDTHRENMFKCAKAVE